MGIDNAGVDHNYGNEQLSSLYYFLKQRLQPRTTDDYSPSCVDQCKNHWGSKSHANCQKREVPVIRDSQELTSC